MKNKFLAIVLSMAFFVTLALAGYFDSEIAIQQGKIIESIQ